MAVISNPDGSVTLRRGGRSTTVRPSDFSALEPIKDTEDRLAGAGKLALQTELHVHIFSKEPLRVSFRLAPMGSVAPAEWWDLKIDPPALAQLERKAV